MKITWLGQAGLLFETNGRSVMIDPYLSDSAAKVNPKSKRRVPVNPLFLEKKPDVIVLTHDHLDHTDPETLAHFLEGDAPVLVLASYNAWQIVRSAFPGKCHNYVSFNRATTWTADGVVFRAVYACHSDERAIGVLIKAEGKTYYVTGDTLYSDYIFEDLKNEKIDAVFLPVNGLGNNMNMQDAARFCEKIGATAVPMHCGLFDDFDLHDFPYENKVVPRFFEEIVLP